LTSASPPSSILHRAGLWLATGLGAGYAPVGPGTAGSLWGPPLVWGVATLFPDPALYSLVAAAIILVGVPICSLAGRHFHRHDPPQCVYDEIAAFFLVFAGVELSLVTAIAGYGLFRLFDIWKPWPVKRLEQLPRGWGVMADDLMAAIYAGVLLYGLDLAWRNWA